MPKEKRTLPLAERLAIRDRLEHFQKRNYRSRRAMLVSAKIPQGTAAAWFSDDPTPPETVSVVRLSEKKNLNLNWLLLGEGPELRGVDREAMLWHQVRQELIADLVSRGATPAEAEKGVPSPDELFAHLARHMRIGWERWKKAPLPKSGAGIGRAIRRYLSGLTEDESPFPSRPFR